MARPSFYCENCGREVPFQLGACPDCGQKFYSVRCPSCGFTGDLSLFKEKCPECGYEGAIKRKKQFSPWFYKSLIIILTVTLLGLIRIFFYL